MNNARVDGLRGSGLVDLINDWLILKLVVLVVTAVVIVNLFSGG